MAEQEVSLELQQIRVEIYQQPIAAFLGQLTKGTEILNAIESVSDPQTCEAAATWVNKAKTLTGLIGKKVDEICRPLKDAKADIDEVQRKVKSYAEEISTPLKEATRCLEGKMIRYNQIQREEADRIRKIAYDMAREAAEKVAKAEYDRKRELELAAQRGEPIEDLSPLPEPMVTIQAPVVIEAPKIKGLTTTWKYEITDQESLPREYLTPDTAKIFNAVKGGCREIPGVRIYDEQYIRKS